jgi:3-dehydroquinate synthase
LAQQAGATYPIDVCPEAALGPACAAKRVAAFARARRLALVGDHTVLALFGAAYREAFERLGLTISVHAFAPGEASKSFAGAEGLIGSLAQAGISRQDVVVGLGGGVVLDLAAFVAGIYLRGVPFVGVATTSLAAVDASVGGKCGVNWGAHKNQLGLIRPPAAVVLDVAAILAQDAPARLAGAVEAVKMGALFSSALMEAVPCAGQDRHAWHQLIAEAVALKIAVCRQDPTERGLRHTLNYGHTIGHAIEAGSGFAIPHGVAVALGMVAEAQFAEAQGLARHIVAPLLRALRAMNMPVDWRRATVQTDALRRDKKGDGHTVLLPVVSHPGRVALHAIPLGHLEQFVRKP